MINNYLIKSRTISGLLFPAEIQRKRDADRDFYENKARK